MEIQNDEILKLIPGKLHPDQIKRSFIYRDKRVRRKGEPIKIGPQTFEMPFEGTLVFIDLAPRMNWAHPCLYVLIDNKTLSTQTIEASFPPFMDEPPQSWIILLRYGEKPPHERYFTIYDSQDKRE